MEWLLYAVIFFVACLYIVPKTIVVVLRIVLRKFSFYASVGGPLTLNEVMLRIPLKMNLAILIRVEQIRIQISLPNLGLFFQSQDKFLSVQSYGLQINLLLRDDFDKWNASKIELLHVIETFRAKLSRLGLLNDPSEKSNEESDDKKQPVIDDQAKDWSETIKNVLSSSSIVAENTQVNFFVYKMDELEEINRNIDENNVQQFYQRCLQNPTFQRKYNCARIFLQTAQADFLRMSEEAYEVIVKTPRLLILNSKLPKESGQLIDVELILNIPNSLELVKDFCNWELNIKIQNGHFDISKGFIKSVLSFFIMMDTLSSIFKEIANLVYKQHFQDYMFLKSGVNQRLGYERSFVNYRDVDIPKKVKLTIVEKLEIDIAYPSERLADFLGKDRRAQVQEPAIESLKIILAPKTTFEMTFRINKTYYLRLETPRIELEANGETCAYLDQFQDEISFVFKQEQTDFKIKQCPLEMTQNINAESLVVKQSPSFMKHILELINYYKFGVARASVKHKIFGQIQDPDFLIENIIETKNPKGASNRPKFTAEQYRELYEVLEIYEFETHLDKVSTQIKINKVRMQHSSRQIYENSLSNELAAFPNSFAADLSVSASDFSFSTSKVGPTEEMNLRCATLCLGQENRMSDSQRKQHGMPSLKPKDSRPLAKVGALSFQQFLKLRFAGSVDPNLPISDRENYKIYNDRFFADRLQLNIDFEFILDRIRDILDYSFVFKHFTRKWSHKYEDLSHNKTEPLKLSDLGSPHQRRRVRVRPRNCTWREVVESRSFYLPVAEVMWNLSRSRMLVLYLEEFRPNGLPTQCFDRMRQASLANDVNRNRHEFIIGQKRQNHCQTVFGVTQLEFIATKATLYHDMQERKERGLIQGSYPVESQPVEIMSADEFKLGLNLKEELTGIGIDAQKLEFHLPHGVLFGPLVNEIEKQVSHVPDWIRQEYKLRKRDLNFQYYGAMEAPSSPQEPLHRGRPVYGRHQQAPMHRQKKPWRVDLNFRQVVHSLEEEPLSQLFTNQNEVSEMLAQRHVFDCSSRSLLNMFKNLKNSGVYQKYWEVRMKNLTGRIEMPERFNDPDFCLKWISNLDEGNMHIHPTNFEQYDAINTKINIEYLAMHGRSLFKPVLEVWNLDLRIESMIVQLNSGVNPGLFQTDAVNRIFNRFPLPFRFNKLPNKFYYCTQMDVQKICIGVQGQQSQLFLNDLTKNLEKLIDIVDLSKSFDDRMKKLPVLGGMWDQIRSVRRGSACVKIKDLEIEVWPKRNLNRYTENLVISCADLEYHKRVIQSDQREARLSHDICLRSLTFKKSPLKQFESALLKFPLIELAIATNYNQGRDNDHFQVLNARDYDDYIRILHDYSTKELAVNVKLNIPSFGTINPAREKTSYLPHLMQAYVTESPIPIVHYQRSQMKFIDSILQEYVNGGKTDISGSVRNYEAKRKARSRNELELRSPKLLNTQGDQVNSLFCLQVQAFLSDMMILFTDFDDSQEEFRLIEQSQQNDPVEFRSTKDPNQQMIDYLSNYQGIIVSTENLSLATTVIIDITNEAQKFQIENSLFKNKFLCLSALNHSNLFQIRNKKLDKLRKQDWPKTMENYNYFCYFFGIDKKTMERFSKLTQGFKTLYPNYVLHNDSIQHAITTATGGYESFFNAAKKQRAYTIGKQAQSLFGEGNFQQQIEEDLNFREGDTIAMIELMEYQQNAHLSYQGKKDGENSCHSNDVAGNEFHKTPSSFKNQGRKSVNDRRNKAHQMLKTGSLQLQYHTDEAPQHSSQSDKILVRHLLDVKNTRFLYSKRVYELLYHHMVNGFDYNKYRKTDYIDIEQEKAKKRSFLDGYMESKSNYTQKGVDSNRRHPYSNLSNTSYRNDIVKQGYIGVRLINTQLNMQDEASKAQALIASEGSTTAVWFAHSDSPEASSGPGIQIQKTKASGRWDTNIVKNEINVQLAQMNLYVAPTYINLEKPTFWRHGQRKQKRPNSARQRNAADESIEIGDTPRSRSPGQEHEIINALRKVLSFNTVDLKYVFLDEDAQDHQNPLLNIDFQLQQVVCEMDSPSMWQFLSVFKGTFLDRGEKSEDIIQIEEARLKDLSKFKPDQLREMIDREVKGTMGSLLNQMKPIFVKRVSYSVELCEFSFFNLNTKFASGHIEQARGMHWIYANKESKTDIDVEKIRLINNLDTDEDMREVLSTYGRRQSTTENSNLHVRESCFKLRTRDKFVVVNEAPWRVFDQYEIFIYPTSIRLTRDFYSAIKSFIFSTSNTDPVDQVDELQDHYENFISSKALQKAMPSAVNNRDVATKAMMDNLSDKSNNKGKKKLSFGMVSKGEKNGTSLSDKDQSFQSFFRYLRINEIQVQITYIHAKNSRLNVHNMQLRLQPFIMHGKFQKMQQVLIDYEKHCKRKVLSQTPNLVTQLLFQVKEKVTEIGNTEERKDEMQLHYAKRVLFGDFADA